MLVWPQPRRKRQRCKCIDDGAAHVPSAKQGQGLACRAEQLRQTLSIRSIDPLKAKFHSATTALPKTGAEHMSNLKVLAVTRQQLARMVDGLKLQVSAANGGSKVVSKHQHAGTGPARHGPLDRKNGHQHSRGLVKFEQSRAQVDQGRSCFNRKRAGQWKVPQSSKTGSRRDRKSVV